MAITYQPLWDLLTKKHLTKTQMRQAAGLSTVVLANMSKNQPVSTSVIEAICKSLNCRIGDVMAITGTTNEVHWDQIKPDAPYLVNLFFLQGRTEEASPDYIYGYAVQADNGVSRRKTWHLNLIEDQKDKSQKAFLMTNTISAEELHKLISCLEQSSDFDTFLKSCSFELRIEQPAKKFCSKSVFCSKPISSTKFLYRPIIYLETARISSDRKSAFQPHHSLGTKPMYCETLVCSDKNKIYHAVNSQTDGIHPKNILDTERMEAIYQLFKQEHILWDGFRDIERIGDFEVFYETADSCPSENVIDIESITEDDAYGRKKLLGLRITLLAKYLHGNYILVTSTENAGNITSFQAQNVNIDRQNVAIELSPPENSCDIEAILFDTAMEGPFQLVAHEKVAFIRDFHFHLQVISRQINLSSRFNHKNQVVQIMQTNNSDFSLSGEASDPWRLQYENVYRDFSVLYKQNDGESYYFHKGHSHEEFLDWIRKKINQQKYHEIWLFDPYIDEKCLPSLLQIVSKLELSVHIVTDGFSTYQKDKCLVSEAEKQNCPEDTIPPIWKLDSAPGNSTEEKKLCTSRRILDITALCREMKRLFSESMEITAICEKKSETAFHDRYLILDGENTIPEVYVLSNSLDGMAKRHSSVMAKLNHSVSVKVVKEYLEHYETAKNSGKLYTILQADMNNPFLNTEQEADIHNQTLHTGQEAAQRETSFLYSEALQYMNQKLKNQNLPPLCNDGDHITFFPENILNNENTITDDNHSEAAEDTINDENHSKLTEKIAGVLSEDLKNDLSYLAELLPYIKFPYKTILIKKCIDRYQNSWQDDMIQKIQMGIQSKEQEQTDYPGALKASMPTAFEDLLTWTDRVWDHSVYELDEFRLDSSARFSFRILLQTDFEGIEKLISSMSSPDMPYDQTLKLQFLLKKLISELQNLDSRQQKNIACACLHSRILDLQAIGMIWCINAHRNESLQETSQKTELVLETIEDAYLRSEFLCHYIVQLQIKGLHTGFQDDKPKNRNLSPDEFSIRKKEYFDCLEKAKSSWCHSVLETSDNLSEAVIERMLNKIAYRSASDVSDLLRTLFTNEMDKDFILKYLIDSFFRKADEIISKKEAYWSHTDFQNTAVFANLLDELYDAPERKILLLGIGQREKKILNVLHDVFLRQKNYNKWHRYMDTLLWLKTIQHVLSKEWKDYYNLIEHIPNGEAEKLIEKYEPSLKHHSEAYKIYIQNK